MAGATPRVNSQYLEHFLNRTVRIVGKVTALHGESATLDAEGPITIHLDRVASCTSCLYRMQALTGGTGCTSGVTQRGRGHRQGQPGSEHQGLPVFGLGPQYW